MVALPFATAVTTPLAFTVATAVLLEDQFTLLFVAFSGATVAVRVPVWPGFSVRVAGATVTPVTWIQTVMPSVAV